MQADLNPWRVEALDWEPIGTYYAVVVVNRWRVFPSSERVAHRYAAWRFRRWLRDSEFARRFVEKKELERESDRAA